MIYDLDTLQVGCSFVRLMLLADAGENSFSVFEHESGTITSIYTGRLFPEDDEVHMLCTVRRHKDGSEQRWFIGDLLGHDDTVICVSPDAVERYKNPTTFGVAPCLPHVIVRFRTCSKTWRASANTEPRYHYDQITS